MSMLVVLMLIAFKNDIERPRVGGPGSGWHFFE